MDPITARRSGVRLLKKCMTLEELATGWLLGLVTFTPNQSRRIANEQAINALSTLIALSGRRSRGSPLA
jgi:Na+/melibiose symporter-like transporter